MKDEFMLIVIIISSLGCGTVAMQCNVLDCTVFCDSTKIPSKIPNCTRLLEIINGFNGTFLPQYFFRYSSLETITIGKSKIKVIKKNTFVDLPVHSLYLDNNGIETIQPGAFRNLKNLELLSLDFNKLTLIQSGTFTKLPIIFLVLSNNSIATIEDSAFSVGTNDPSGLTHLMLMNNSLKALTNDMLKGLTNLRSLNVEFNEIGTIESGAFERTPKLFSLNLANNKIKKIDGSIFPRRGLPSLRNLYLGNNEMMYLTFDFLFRLSLLKRISLVGNPWLCPCLDVISRVLYDNEIKEVCQGPFNNGEAPVCISELTETKCSYKYNNELSASYLETRKILDKWRCDL